MSSEAANTWAAPGHPAAPGPTAHPQSPMFVATVDRRRGSIRTRGHLDRVGADLLRGSVVALQALGHRHIILRIPAPATADAGARALLAELAEQLAADGVLLTVE